MKIYHYPLVTILLFFSLSIFTQTIQLERKMPTVEQYGTTLALGFAGGLNSPQFNEADLNNDGRNDLFLFDRVGNIAIAMRRKSDGTFALSQRLIQHFPDMEEWVLLRDYNGDGAMDIFTYNRDQASGIKVFRGFYGSDNLLNFERVSFDYLLDIIPVATPTGGVTQLYVSDIDYPSISDVDCDGDLDILTFNIGGGLIEYFQNQSIENGYGLDSLQYELATNCYGGIYESGISESLSLSSSSGDCAEGFVGGDDTVEDRHVGSTLLSLDEDGDGDEDLILGDLSFPNLNMSTNAGSCGNAWMNEQDLNFPSYDLAVDLPIFPAAFYVDIDGDNIRDLVAAPNPGNNGIDHEN
ncbi:MAG: VCBS repeat-containing protein, partial [Bacteroidota bacterium]